MFRVIELRMWRPFGKRCTLDVMDIIDMINSHEVVILSLDKDKYTSKILELLVLRRD